MEIVKHGIAEMPEHGEWYDLVATGLAEGDKTLNRGQWGLGPDASSPGPRPDLSLVTTVAGGGA